MDGPASAGIATAISTAASTIVAAFVNRGAVAGVKELRTQVERYFGSDGNGGPGTEWGKLVARVTTVEGAISSAVGVAEQFGSLRTWTDGQIRGIAERVGRVERGQRTGSQPSLVDQHARDEAAEAIERADAAIRKAEAAERNADVAEARVRELVQAREADRAAAVELQMLFTRLDTTLELLVGGSISPGGKSK